MGTRNLTCVYIDGRYKVAQYGQWDGYPEGQGKTCLRFLKQWNRQRFETNVRACEYLTPDEIKARWVDCGADPNDDFVSLAVADAFDSRYPELSRNTAAKVLAMIEREGPLALKDELSFSTDSLFCEWCYVIDLDKNVFEVYEGFNKSPVAEDDRFYTPEQGGEYYPVKLVNSFGLDNLPSEEDLLRALYEEEEA